jgi:hypothetical protein
VDNMIYFLDQIRIQEDIPAGITSKLVIEIYSVRFKSIYAILENEETFMLLV